jgi:hypothetical protein
MGTLILVFILAAVLVLVAGGSAMARSRRRLREYDETEDTTVEYDDSEDG